MVRPTYTLTDSLYTSLFQIHHLTAEGEGELLGLELSRDIGTGEGPVEDGNWAGQHSLRWFLRTGLSVAAPLHGDRVRTADVGDNDGRADVSRTVTLDQTESIEVFTEALNHAIPLRFTVNEEIKTKPPLEGYDVFDRLPDEVSILLLCEFTLAH